jgi:tRNA threonylcarbamoyladenosine biosynthesis protein TsaE
LLNQPLPVEVMLGLMLSRHDTILESRQLAWVSEADCAVWAQTLASHNALRNACIELHGPLGAGKTTFVRHLLRALGVHGRIKSPTYAVVEPHRVGTLDIWHFDFYRFDDPREWADAGLRELFTAPGLKLVEWPDKAAGALPAADLSLHIEPHDDGSRQVQVQAGTPRGLELLS